MMISPEEKKIQGEYSPVSPSHFKTETSVLGRFLLWVKLPAPQLHRAMEVQFDRNVTEVEEARIRKGFAASLTHLGSWARSPFTSLHFMLKKHERWDAWVRFMYLAEALEEGDVYMQVCALHGCRCCFPNPWDDWEDGIPECVSQDRWYGRGR